MKDNRAFLVWLAFGLGAYLLYSAVKNINPLDAFTRAAGIKADNTDPTLSPGYTPTFNEAADNPDTISGAPHGAVSAYDSTGDTSMVKSLNGWQVPPPHLHTFTVPGTNRRLTLDRDAGPLLVALAADYHRTVKPIDVGTVDEGGYNNRDANGAPGRKSNHASGTAVDLNWSKEGAQASKTGRVFFANKEHRDAVNLIKRRYGSVIQWGGDWGAKDYMHWEIKPGVTRAQVQTLIKKLGISAEGVRRGT